MGQEARDELMGMVENQRTWKRWLQLIPMPVFRRLMAWAVMRKTRDLSAEERRLMQNLCDALQQLPNKQDCPLTSSARFPDYWASSRLKL